MKYYELTYLITSSITEEEAEGFQNKIVALIQAEEGVLSGEKHLLKKKLAYTIKKPSLRLQENQAYLAVLNFQLDPGRIANLEKKLEQEHQVLRYLILTKEKPKIIPGTFRAPAISEKPKTATQEKTPVHDREKKVELKEIEKKLEEILEK